MRQSEFLVAVTEEFGAAYGQVVLHDVALTALGSRTAHQALRDGLPCAEVWIALCRECDIPPQRWHGRGLADSAR